MRGGDIMATWKCECGYSKEGRCKPQKCEKCGEKGKFVKAEQFSSVSILIEKQQIEFKGYPLSGYPFLCAPGMARGA